jgi:hypothetical protein
MPIAEQASLLARHLAGSWSGEAGWDTTQLIKAVAAAKGHQPQTERMGFFGRREES